jgi:DnaJ-class molecular chaperone
LKYHPKISKLNPSKAYQKFCQVAEAYEVLSNKRMKAFYDEFGEVKLKQGIFINEKLRRE